MEATFQSVLELVRNDPSAIVDDSSFDKITDTLCEVCRVDGNFLSTLFQYVPSIEEIIPQLTASMNLVYDYWGRVLDTRGCHTNATLHY